MCVDAMCAVSHRDTISLSYVGHTVFKTNKSSCSIIFITVVNIKYIHASTSQNFKEISQNTSSSSFLVLLLCSLSDAMAFWALTVTCMLTSVEDVYQMLSVTTTARGHLSTKQENLQQVGNHVTFP